MSQKAKAVAQPRGFQVIVAENIADGGFVAMPDLETMRGGVSFAPMPRAEETQRAFPETENGGFQHAHWGNADNFPTLVRQKLERVPIAQQTIYRLVAMMYGNGIAWRDNATGEVPAPAIAAEIRDWMQQCRFQTLCWPGICTDYRYLQNAFVEFTLSKDRKRITGAYWKQAEHTRLSVQNEKTFEVEYILYHPKFAWGTGVHPEETVKIPLFNPTVVSAAEFFGETNARGTGWLKGKKFAMHLYFPTPGMTYYARPLGIMGLMADDSWVDVSADVPKIVRAMQRNQILVKYQLFIPDQYFIDRHQNWAMMSFEEQQTIFKNKLKDINTALEGTTNAYASLAQMVRQDRVTGTVTGKIEIHAVEDKAKTDVWVPSSLSADSQIVTSLGGSAAMMNLQKEGGSMGAGSGSSQREDYNISIALNTMEQDILLEALRVVAAYNGWNASPYVQHDRHTTLNENSSGIVPAAQPVPING